MSIQRTYLCDGPACNGSDPDDADAQMPRHAVTALAPPHLPVGFIETRERDNGVDHLNHFCSWDCAMKYASQFPAPEIIDA